MKICKTCGNKIRDKAIFCDKCGNFLNLNYSHDLSFKGDPRKKNFKKLLLYISKHISEDEDGRIYHDQDLTVYYGIIVDYLNQLTNIKNILKKNNLSFSDISKDIFETIFLIKNESSDYILENFLFYLNDKLNNVDLRKLNFKVIFYSNIGLKNMRCDEFLQILDFFDLSIFNIQNIQFTEEFTEPEKNVFESDYLIIESKINGKNFHLMIENAVNNLHSFYGFLTFISKFSCSTKFFSSNIFNTNYQYSDLDSSAMILLKEDNTMFHDPPYQKHNYDILRRAPKLKESDVSNFKKLSLMPDFINVLIVNNNTKLIVGIKDIFRLYYEASREKDLDNSFIKFYSLNERIIKKIFNGANDENLIRYIDKLLKFYYKNNFFYDRLRVVHKKRNKLIHELEFNISQNDRNFLKFISDNLIYFLMEFFGDVKNFEDYGVILSNYNLLNVDKTLDLIKFSSELRK